MQTHSFRSKPSRAALMATLGKILIVLVQFSLAATLLRRAPPAVEREPIPAVAALTAGTGADNVIASRGDPKWLALVRVPPPSRTSPSSHREGTACS
jgi:hypothetical protein